MYDDNSKFNDKIIVSYRENKPLKFVFNGKFISYILYTDIALLMF